jgi:hypothetical protein
VRNKKKPVRNSRAKSPRPGPRAKPPKAPPSLKTANQQLQKQVQELQAQCKNYRDLLQQLIPAPFTPEELIQFATDDDESKCQPLEQFIGELEAIVRKKGA